MTLLTSHRSVPQQGGAARRRPLRLHLEALEERIVPSYFPPTADGIHIFEDQLPDNLLSAMTQFVATHIDGTQKELLSQTDQFRAINPNFTVLHYQLGTGNSPYDYIINNQWSSDWSFVNGQENWFAHQTYAGEPQSAANLTSGRVGNSSGWDQADIANSAWQQYTLNQVLQNIAATGSNGWFADSFTFGLGGAGYDGTIPTRYQGTNAAKPADWPGGIDWTDQLANWAQTVEAAFAKYNAANGTDYQFIPNLDARITSWEPDWYDNTSGVPFLDGAFLEGFGETTDTYDWTLAMNQGLNFTDNGKIVIMQPYPSAAPTTAAGQQQVNFLLGTYLLLKGNETYLNIDYGGGVQYYPQYEVNLGPAVTPLQSSVSGYFWNNVYRRDFQNGFVLVNPGSTTYTLNLGNTYRLAQGSGGGTMTDTDLDANGNYIGGSLSYQNMSSVTLTGGSAAIFLKTPTTTTLVDNGPNPSDTGQAVTFTVNVSGGVPAGDTVILEDANNGNAQIGPTGTLANGSASITVPAGALSVGTHQVFAVYGGDSAYAASQSSADAQVVHAVDNIALASVKVNGSTAPVIAARESGITVTITTDGASGFAINDHVLIAGVGSGYNGAWTIASVNTSSNSFSYTASTSSLATVTDQGTATDTNASTGLLSGAQRSMVDSIVYVFNQAVSLSSSALSIMVHSGQPGTAPTLSWASPDGGVIWVATFSGGSVIGNSIADGVYDVTLDSSQVTAVSGSGTLAAGEIDTFYRLFGDLRGNETANNYDNRLLIRALGSSAGSAAFAAAMDYNGDGTINNTDNRELVRRLGVIYSGFTPTI
jgi:hypothetical protein